MPRGKHGNHAKANRQKGYVLHHKNEVKSDNRLGNLELKRRGQHSAGHLAARSRDERGRFGALLDGREHREFPT